MEGEDEASRVDRELSELSEQRYLCIVRSMSLSLCSVVKRTHYCDGVDGGCVVIDR